MPAPLTLPVISISPYLPSQRDQYSEADRAKVAQGLHRACRDIGFFYLKVDDYLTETERRTVLEAGRKFFLESSEDEKAAIGLEHGDGARGELSVLVVEF
jgi:isopenicillin N synthase-like dioxygenase